eukprot:4157351-Amphidinium_carterae.1
MEDPSYIATTPEEEQLFAEVRARAQSRAKAKAAPTTTPSSAAASTEERLLPAKPTRRPPELT